MGATASHHSPDHPPTRALHVLRVIPGSPAADAGVQVFFDFIVGIDGFSHGTNVSISDYPFPLYPTKLSHSEYRHSQLRNRG